MVLEQVMQFTYGGMRLTLLGPAQAMQFAHGVRHVRLVVVVFGGGLDVPPHSVKLRQGRPQPIYNKLQHHRGSLSLFDGERPRKGSLVFSCVPGW